MTRRTHLSIACTAALLFASTGAASSQDLETSLRLTTRLGVTTTVSVRQVKLDDPILYKALSSTSGYTFGNLFLRLADGVYLGIQIAQIEDVAISDGEAVVSLSDGQQYLGNLIGTVVAQDSREYDLTSVSRLEVQSSPPFRESKLPQSEMLWQLHISVPQDLKFSLHDPRFEFEYYSTSGYAIGGGHRRTSSSSFYIKIGEDELLANLGDFQSVSLGATADSRTVPIRVTTRSGVETVGILRLMKKDDKGIHEANRWALVGTLPNSVRIALVNCEAALMALSE